MGEFRAITLRGAWRLAGILFLGGALSTVPALLLLEKTVDLWVYGLVVLAAGIGIGCMLVPWQRIDERWLAATPVVAVIAIAVGVAATSYVFTYLYFFVAVFVALVYPTPRRMLPFLALIAVALVLPLLYSDEPIRSTLIWVLATAPGVLFIAFVVARLTANLEASREAYRKLSGEDGLTGVGNYRALMERLRHEVARHHRRTREFTLLTLDLDDFKSVNEIQGHLVGDLVLAIVGSMIDLKVRTEDAVFRQGGDEFCVVAPETGRVQGEMLAQRIGDALARITSGQVTLSATIGMAVFPYDGHDAGELLDAADISLRSGKPAKRSLVGAGRGWRP